MTLSSLRLRLQSAPRIAPPQWWSGLREYFSYHGAWAPGVRALRLLSVRAKVLLVMGILSAPLAPLAWHVVADQNEAVSQSGQRLAGVHLAAAAWALRVELGAVTRAEQSGVPLPQDGRGRADEQLRDAYSQALDAGLDVRLNWERGRAAVERAVQAPRGATADSSELAAHARAALVELRDAAIADPDVQLTEDPQLQRAARLALEDLPSLQLSLSKLRALVHGFSSEGDRHEATVRLAMALAELRHETRRVVTLMPQDGTDRAARLAAVSAYADLIHRLVLAKDGNPDLNVLRAANEAARIEGRDLRQQKVQLVEDQLQHKARKAEQIRLGVFAALAVSAGLALYLVYCFFLVMRGGLMQLNHQMARMADGDLSARLAPLGVDEVAQTMQSMTAALTRLSDLLASVRQGVGAVKQASQQVAEGNKDLSARNHGTAQGVAAVLDGVLRNADQLAACGRQVETVVGLVQALRLESARNRKQMARLRERMTSLRGKSHEIGEIVSLIDNIAFRTNVLALNASIEASKAGDAGRGFAVVAQEVRSLAQRGAEAARRIGDIVLRSTDDIEHSGALAEETGRALARADEQVDQIHLAMDGVTALTRSGEAESGQILEQLTHIKDDTAQGLRQVEQLASASDALRSQGERLAHKVAQFRLA